MHKFVLSFFLSMLFIVSSNAFAFGTYKIDASVIKQGFNNDSPMICWTTSPGARWSPGRDNITFVKKDRYMLVNDDTNFLNKNLSGPRFSISDCEIIKDRQIFYMNDGEYILLNGKPEKIKK